MITHDDIWRAIETIARERNMSVSALAKKAGLDPTSFNKSKRVSLSGRPRWPSTESMARVLDAAEMTLRDLADIVEFGSQRESFVEVPVVTLEQLGATGFDAFGFPFIGSFESEPLPNSGEAGAFIVEGGETPPSPMFSFQKLIVSPSRSFRRGDLVLLRTSKGDVFLGRFVVKLKTTTELKLVANDESAVIVNSDILWSGRVLWLTPRPGQ